MPYMTTLYCRLEGETQPQAAYVDLDLENGTVNYDYVPFGNSVPMAVYNKTIIRFSINPATLVAELDKLLDSPEWQQCKRTVLEDSKIVWGGRSHIGVIGEKAEKAIAEMKRMLEALPQAEVVEPEDWLHPRLSYRDGLLCIDRKPVLLENLQKFIERFPEEEEIDGTVYLVYGLHAWLREKAEENQAQLD